MRNALSEKLGGKTYDPEKVKKWTVELANEISDKVTGNSLSNRINIKILFSELKMKRYKHIVQVTLGEHRGAGVKSGARCLWDAETDGYTSEIFSNVSWLFINKKNIYFAVSGYNFLFGCCLCCVFILGNRTF